MGSGYLYKLCDENDWGIAPVFRGTADDLRDGFIHLSTAQQVPGTFAKYFAGKRGLLLLRVEVDKIERGLRWEPSRGGALFPHFYGTLDRYLLTCVGLLPESADGGSILPDEWRRDDGELESRADAPDDWMDVRGWDLYWRQVLADRQRTRVHTRGWDFERTSRRYAESFRSRGSARVLIAGNGIELDPHGLAHMGLDATVVEVSEVACRFLASPETAQRALDGLFVVRDEVRDGDHVVDEPVNPDKTRQRAIDQHRPGGRVAIVNEDLFEYEPEEPFDLILSRRAYQGFAFARRQGLARRFYRWLRPGGIAHVHMQNIHEREDFEGPFTSAGFAPASGWGEVPATDKSVRFWHSRG